MAHDRQNLAGVASDSQVSQKTTPWKRVCVSTLCISHLAVHKPQSHCIQKSQQAHSTHAIQDLALFENLQGQPDLKNGTDTRPKLYVPSGCITMHTLPDIPMVLMATLHKLPA